MNQYRNKLVYDAQTGDIKDDKKHMSMLEDFFLPPFLAAFFLDFFADFFPAFRPDIFVAMESLGSGSQCQTKLT